MQPVAIIPKMALLGTIGWGNFATFLRFFASHQWRNSDFAAVSRRLTAAAAGAQVRLLKKLSRTFFRQKMTYSSKKQFFNKMLS